MIRLVLLFNYWTGTCLCFWLGCLSTKCTYVCIKNWNFFLCRISVRKRTGRKHMVSACPEQSCFFLHLSMWSCWFWIWFKSAHNDRSLRKAEITNTSNFLAHASAIAEVGKYFGGNAAELMLIRHRALNVVSAVEGRKRMGAVVFVLRKWKIWYWWSLSHPCAHMFLSCPWKRI